MTLILVSVLFGGMFIGWQMHRLYLRRLHQLSLKITRVQKGGRWHKK